jgi:hypothetical protein
MNLSVAYLRIVAHQDRAGMMQDHGAHAGYGNAPHGAMAFIRLVAE